MRLAFVLRGGLHPSGVVEIIPAYLGLLAGLARRHEVHAFVLQHLPAPQSYVLRGIHVHDLGRPTASFGLARAAQYRALVRTLRAHVPFDLIHGIWGDPAGLLATLAGRALGVPSVVTCDSGEFVSVPDAEYGMQRTARGQLTMTAVAHLATRLHTCTHYAAAQAARLGWHTDVWPIGIDPSPFARAVVPPDGPPWRLLQVASLNRVKHQALAIDAVTALMRRGLDIELDLVGEDTLAGALQAHARDAGVADRVRVHGFLDQAALVPLLHRAHLYVQTSWHEGAGVSVLEAAAAGVPIVGTRVGYVADWAADATAAIDGASAATLADTIAALLASPERRHALGTAALARVRAIDLAVTIEACQACYASLPERSSSPTSRPSGRYNEHTHR
ncbi:MAG: glycosyltransferase family 4 protein [Vicinamibacterales bacterium]